MNRRDFCKFLPVFALEASTIARARAQSTLARRRPFIDAHCHFFNAKDLPVRGFIQQVVLGDYQELKQRPSFGFLPGAESIWKGLAALLVKQLLNSGTPTPHDELQCLADPSSCDDFARFTTLAARRSALTRDDSQRPESRLLLRTLEDHYAETQAPAASRSLRALSEDDQIDAFVDFALEEMKAKGRIAPQATARSLRTEQSARSLLLPNVVDFVIGGDSIFSRYFRWANLLTSYRAQIVAAYIELYQSVQRRLMLAAPALVDFAFWLDDQRGADLQDQIRLMGELSLRQSVPVHGFVPFDPARDLRHEPGRPTSLAIVQQAITQHGFLGVKLYSPMGFRPSGNAFERDFPPSVAQNDPAIGKLLDEHLFAFYEWCASEDVPILAHTTDSQAANKHFGERADPEFWVPVLEKHNGLRVNLAHFGNFAQARDANKQYDIALYPKTWEAHTARLIADGRFPNLCADISYFGWVLGRDSTDARSIRAIKTMCAEFLRADPAAERLLFATDWSFIAREDKFEAYLDGIEAFFGDLGLGEAAMDNIFYKNSLRFLGLRSGDKVFSRLEEFYAKHGKPTPSFG